MPEIRTALWGLSILRDLLTPGTKGVPGSWSLIPSPTTLGLPGLQDQIPSLLLLRRMPSFPDCEELRITQSAQAW